MKATLPLYAQLKEDLIASIARGELAPGDQLPSQRELAERHSMSHMTIRRAIDELRHEGVVHAIPGKGLYVAQPKLDAESDPLLSFTQEMDRRGQTAASQVLAAELVGASTVLARTLGLEVGERLVHLARLRLADGTPMALQTSYLAYALCPGLLEQDLEQMSLYEVLRGVYGLRLVRSRRTAEATLADRQNALALGLSLPAALLVVEQITFLDSGVAVEFSTTAYRGDLYRLPLR